MTNNFDSKSKNVMITSASSGIGRSFAYEFARRGAHLILVARSAQILRELCDELMATYPIRAIVIVADLTEIAACKRVYTEACSQNFAPSVLVNNAGFATYGCFDQLPLDCQHAEIMLNV
jgi:short-subunit dehydrogenase